MTRQRFPPRAQNIPDRILGRKFQLKFTARAEGTIRLSHHNLEPLRFLLENFPKMRHLKGHSHEKNEDT
jgi:hypothetical protein